MPPSESIFFTTRLLHILLQQWQTSRVKKLSLLLALSVVTSAILMNSAEASPPKTGSVCRKLNQKIISAGYAYTCVKSGKKLVWSKGKKIEPVSDNSETSLQAKVSGYWAEWRARQKHNDPPVIVISQDGYEKKWEEITLSTSKYVMNVFEGNNFKLVQTPYWVYGDTEEFRKQAYDVYQQNAPCHPPYIPNLPDVIYCAIADIGAGGLRIGRDGQSMANGYQLTTNDEKLLMYFIGHEMGIFYEVQAQYGSSPYTGIKDQIPSWIREGTAQIIGILITNDLSNNQGSYRDLIGKVGMLPPKPTQICTKDLQMAEGKDKSWPDSCSHGMNFYAVQLLVANHGGLDALFKFHRMYGTNTDWPNVFKEAFGISREDFYREWWTYLGVPRTSWPEIMPATPAEHY